MLSGQIVHCPNCGGLAAREYFQSSHCGRRSSAGASTSATATDADTDTVVMQTRCRACDYSMSMCLSSGLVLEAYAPGIRADFPAASTGISTVISAATSTSAAIASH